MPALIGRGALILIVLLASSAGGASAQTYVPESSSPLKVSFQVERLGGSRVLIFGEVRNDSGATYDRVVLLAEGLDGTGRVVSRARAYLSGGCGPRGRASFEVRLSSTGAERRFRVEVESFQRLDN
ncbi:MAG TPA: hypothetical protein VMT79_21725 [Candidatus Binatia bacterium]|nr:hypothetical protein [Candidatus Binatia bacterium]